MVIYGIYLLSSLELLFKKANDCHQICEFLNASYLLVIYLDMEDVPLRCLIARW
jgi:hypothetical protein